MALTALPLLLGLAWFWQTGKNREQLSLPHSEFWQPFERKGPIQTVTWLGTFSYETWIYQSPAGFSLEIKRHLGKLEDLRWLLKDWSIRTKNLQTFAVDPYFPAITKEGECAPAFRPKIVLDTPDSTTLFSLGAGSNLTPGACNLEEIKFRMLRKIFLCKRDSDEGALLIADLFAPLNEDLMALQKELEKLPCSSFFSQDTPISK
jgi:hypothetical protein